MNDTMGGAVINAIHDGRFVQAKKWAPAPRKNLSAQRERAFPLLEIP